MDVSTLGYELQASKANGLMTGFVASYEPPRKTWFDFLTVHCVRRYDASIERIEIKRLNGCKER